MKSDVIKLESKNSELFIDHDKIEFYIILRNLTKNSIQGRNFISFLSGNFAINISPEI